MAEKDGHTKKCIAEAGDRQRKRPHHKLVYSGGRLVYSGGELAYPHGRQRTRSNCIPSENL